MRTFKEYFDIREAGEFPKSHFYGNVPGRHDRLRELESMSKNNEDDFSPGEVSDDMDEVTQAKEFFDLKEPFYATELRNKKFKLTQSSKSMPEQKRTEFLEKLERYYKELLPLAK